MCARNKNRSPQKLLGGFTYLEISPIKLDNRLLGYALPRYTSLRRNSPTRSVPVHKQDDKEAKEVSNNTYIVVVGYIIIQSARLFHHSH